MLAGAIPSIATDAALHAAGIYPAWGQRMSDALFLLALAYRIVYNLAGCYIAARLAPDRPVQHALALGVIGLAVSIAGAVAMWDAGPPGTPSRSSQSRYRVPGPGADSATCRCAAAG